MLIYGMLTRFGYIKLNSLMLGRLFVILAAFGYGDDIIHIVYLILLQLNILEAILLDGVKKQYYNAFSGILVLISSFYLVLNWTGSSVIVENEIYILWIIAYTIWNANFVTLQLSGAYFTHHYLILLSPIVACLLLLDFSYWLMFRETSLLLGMTTLATVKGKLHNLEHGKPFSTWMEQTYAHITHKNTQALLLVFVSICVVVQLFLMNM
jgi:hypothetical protein